MTYFLHTADRGVSMESQEPLATQSQLSDYLDCREAARILRVTPAWVADLCRSGQLAASQPGRAWLIKPTDLEAYIASHSNQPTEGVA